MHNIIVTGVSSANHEERSSVFLINFLFNMNYILPVIFQNLKKKTPGKICVGNIVNMKNSNLRDKYFMIHGPVLQKLSM